jgi:RNase H-fold protein (predicted Holliday junction resolvase)
MSHSKTFLALDVGEKRIGVAVGDTAVRIAVSYDTIDIAPKLEFQDESLTSVLAEQQLKSYGRPYTKGDIDARAAAIILQDYLERH